MDRYHLLLIYYVKPCTLLYYKPLTKEWKI